MTHLARDQRRQLENTVKRARVEAEQGVQAALSALAVDKPQPFGHQLPDDRALRNSLRARAKQLGEVNDTTPDRGYKRLVHAVAYEHWHRMLFARFLAERNLLLHPSGVAVTLADSEELARDENARNGWELAGRYAARMLPQIFRPDDPALAVALPAEYEQALEKLLASLDPAVFEAKDALGWVYQFWQAQKKDEVNKSEVKIGADELPAVTQLFTEPYMVQFLLHNTLGAWWAGKVLNAQPELATTALDEAELRAACALPGVQWTYLRFVKEETGWRPAAGTFEGWPKHARDIKALDPCCGSGHFLCEMLELLTALRCAEEQLDVPTACDAVLRDNLHGLEIDPRCTELAAFAVALTAWSLPGHEGVRPLPDLKIACSGRSLGVTKAEWRKLAEDRQDLLAELDQLWLDFEKATVLGSLIQPRKVMGSLFESSSGQLQAWLRAQAGKERAALDAEGRELAVAALGAATAAELLSGHYTLVATNVPYLGRGKQDEVLKAYCQRNHCDAKADLATCFIERCLQFCVIGGTSVVVSPQAWLFLGLYEQLRRAVLGQTKLNCVARLGPNAFQDMNWWAATTSLSVHTCEKPSQFNTFFGIDVAKHHEPSDKQQALRLEPHSQVLQLTQVNNPDAVIIIGEIDSSKLLGVHAESVHGLAPGDTARLTRPFWELPRGTDAWKFMCSTPRPGDPYSGKSELVFDPKLISKLNIPGFRFDGTRAWGRRGIFVGKMNMLPVSFYDGEVFDNNGHVLLPKNPSELEAIFTFASSVEFAKVVREINQKVAVETSTIVKIPFDLAHWTAVAAAKYPNGLPKPHSDDPTQWLFNGHPLHSDHPLQVAVARLCDYRWPRQTGSAFPDCPALPADGLELFADNDGIVCLPAVQGERPAADRVRELLAAAYGEQWHQRVLQKLLSDVGYAEQGLEAWLDKAFFEQHCKLFHHRPFIWQIWDGVQGGFSALLNYHRLDYKTLEKLTYTYLGDWLERQNGAVKRGEDGAQARVAAAKVLQGELQKILDGEPPYDLFVRWKPKDKQAIGWQPDLDDGVRMNIRPFILAKDLGKKGAGILKAKPNIKWETDRGKDVASAPWYGVFQGERVNDHHISLVEKRAAKDKG